MLKMARRRRTVSVACVALIVLAAVLPLGGVSLDWVVVPATFVLLQTLTSTGAAVESLRCDAPKTGYLRTIEPRGPPNLSLA
jgi:hypothetical protein